MDLSLEQELVHTPDLRHRVRHLKWFRRSFRRCADLVTTHFGAGFDISDARLARAFLNWAELFEQQKAYARVEPRDFAAFAGGLLLQELLREKPAEPKRAAALLEPPRGAPIDAIVAFWPAGFLATSYCLSVLNAVAKQDFHKGFSLGAECEDVRIWRSFRENVSEEPSRAVGFLDLFVGNQPNWAQPDWAPARPGVRRAVARSTMPRTRLLH